MVVSLDYSDAVEVNYAAHGQNDRVLIVQADIYRMPFRPQTFDRVFCFGVLQHTPDPSLAFAQLPVSLKPGGAVAIDVYLKYTGIKGLLDTKYWARPFTRRIPPQILYPIVSGYVRVMWPLVSLLGQIPRIGIRISRKLLIADHRDIFALSEDQLREWAILDTFDTLSPAYDYPQRPETVERWFQDAGLGRPGVVVEHALVVARTPPVRSASGLGIHRLGSAQVGP